MTNAPLKPDADEICAYSDSLGNKSWLKNHQKWWPGHLFHFTDIENAVNIVKNGCIFSRNRLEATKHCFRDIANPEVIRNTTDENKGYARLYFRPKTPTQFSNEGFRPKRSQPKAHCPVPVFFVFNAKPVLSRKEVLFSDGNLGCSGKVKIGDSYEFFKTIPFRSVYHDDAFKAEERDEIVFHRHAEVLVPEQLDLRHLKYILCRSEAEYETFITLADRTSLRNVDGKISFTNKYPVFFSHWPYVYEARLFSDKAEFRFNPNSRDATGPFNVKLTVTEKRGGRLLLEKEKQIAELTGKLLASFPSRETPAEYKILLEIDGHIAYANVFDMSDDMSPF